MEREGESDLFPMIAPPALPTFDLTLRGYDRRQVDEYLDRLEHDLSVAQADRDAAAARIALTEKRLNELEHELQAARAQLTESSHPTYAGLGKRVEQLLSIAEEEADRLREEALRDTAEERAAAGTLVQGAQKQAEQAQRDFDAALDERRREAQAAEEARRADADKRMALAEQRIAEAEAAATSRIAEAQQAAEQLFGSARAEAERKVSEATAHSERLRKDAEQHATALVQAARHDVDRIALEAKSQAESIVADARAKAEHGRSEHDREIAELIRRRQHIREQLKALRQVVGSLPDSDGDEEDHATLVTPPEETPDMPPGQAAERNPEPESQESRGLFEPRDPAPTRPSPTPKPTADEAAPSQRRADSSPRPEHPRTQSNLRKTGT